jgi:hypothetical protein
MVHKNLSQQQTKHNPEINKAQNLTTPKYTQDYISTMYSIINTKLKKSEANVSQSTLTIRWIKKQKQRNPQIPCEL